MPSEALPFVVYDGPSPCCGVARAALALIADLANLDKHGKLNGPPRSGNVPHLSAAKGATKLDGSWQLRLDIEHGGQELDGVQVAADAVQAWRRVLTEWGLI